MRFVAATLLLCLFLPGCRSRDTAFQGYIEGDFIFISSPVGGLVIKRPVNRGSKVRAGEELFALEHDREDAVQLAAREQLARATAQLENLQKGKRPSEIAALEARIAEAEAGLQFATKEKQRVDKLAKTDVVPRRDFDEAHAQFDRATATLSALRAELATARLGAREDEIAAAKAEVAVRQQELRQASWSVQQKTKQAPVDGVITDTFFEPGELAAAGAPVVSLLNPQSLKVRFFVPEHRLSTITLGQKISIAADGLSAPLDATVSFVSPQAEFTPPVIFSRQTRDKLVFMVEAAIVPDKGTTLALNPGQPVDIELP